MTTEQEVAAFITEQVRAAQKISGARLGYVLNSRIPGFRQRFGALRFFVERVCADQVGVIQAAELGGDFFYVPASMLSAAQAAAPKVAEAPDSAWRAFTAPNSVSRLCINTESGDFRVRLKTELEPEPPWVVIPSVMPEDHRQIASAFLTEIAPEDRSSFEQTVKLPNFWSAWSTTMRTFQQGKYSKQWAVFRFNKLCHLYLDRAKTVGVGEELAAESLRRLKALKSASREFAQSTALKSPATSPSNLPIRKLAVAALEAMSEDELRQVWLPLGPVANAIGKCHSQ